MCQTERAQRSDPNKIHIFIIGKAYRWQPVQTESNLVGKKFDQIPLMEYDRNLCTPPQHTKSFHYASALSCEWVSF